MHWKKKDWYLACNFVRPKVLESTVITPYSTFVIPSILPAIHLEAFDRRLPQDIIDIDN